jgi:hypothetical protein
MYYLLLIIICYYLDRHAQCPNHTFDLCKTLCMIIYLSTTVLE